VSVLLASALAIGLLGSRKSPRLRGTFLLLGAAALLIL
jgi:hypothetical protein